MVSAKLESPDSVRTFADKIMPWSIYQDIQGATFLLNMAALLKAKMTTLNSLNILQEFASPWLSTRLDSIIYRVRRGDHLGLALRQCGYQFPSREAANFLSLLQGDGATELISNYGQRWLSQTLQRKETGKRDSFNYADISCHVSHVTGFCHYGYSVY